MMLASGNVVAYDPGNRIGTVTLEEKAPEAKARKELCFRLDAGRRIAIGGPNGRKNHFFGGRPERIPEVGDRLIFLWTEEDWAEDGVCFVKRWAILPERRQPTGKEHPHPSGGKRQSRKSGVTRNALYLHKK